MSAVAELMAHIGLIRACRAFVLNPGFVYRDLLPAHGIGDGGGQSSRTATYHHQIMNHQ
jgi:hypothetical protein